MFTKSRRGETINCDSRKTAMRKSQGKLTDLQNQTKYTKSNGETTQSYQNFKKSLEEYTFEPPIMGTLG